MKSVFAVKIITIKEFSCLHINPNPGIQHKIPKRIRNVNVTDLQFILD